MGLDGVVPESTNRVQGKSAAEGGSAIGKAAGAVVKKSDVLANPPKGRTKNPAEVVVPSSNVPGAEKSDVPPDPKGVPKRANKGRGKSAAEGGSAIGEAAGAVNQCVSNVLQLTTSSNREEQIKFYLVSANR